MPEVVATRNAARSQVRRGSRLRWRTVPASSDVSARQERHSSSPRPGAPTPSGRRSAAGEAVGPAQDGHDGSAGLVVRKRLRKLGQRPGQDDRAGHASTLPRDRCGLEPVSTMRIVVAWRPGSISTSVPTRRSWPTVGCSGRRLGCMTSESLTRPSFPQRDRPPTSGQTGRSVTCCGRLSTRIPRSGRGSPRPMGSAARRAPLIGGHHSPPTTIEGAILLCVRPVRCHQRPAPELQVIGVLKLPGRVKSRAIPDAPTRSSD